MVKRKYIWLQHYMNRTIIWQKTRYLKRLLAQERNLATLSRANLTNVFQVYLY